ncbi:hypothetical protein ACJJTC_003988 [Scirpophaga incertulas]
MIYNNAGIGNIMILLPSWPCLHNIGVAESKCLASHTHPTANWRHKPGNPSLGPATRAAVHTISVVPHDFILNQLILSSYFCAAAGSQSPAASPTARASCTAPPVPATLYHRISTCCSTCELHSRVVKPRGKLFFSVADATTFTSYIPSIGCAKPAFAMPFNSAIVQTNSIVCGGLVTDASGSLSTPRAVRPSLVILFQTLASCERPLGAEICDISLSQLKASPRKMTRWNRGLFGARRHVGRWRDAKRCQRSAARKAAIEGGSAEARGRVGSARISSRAASSAAPPVALRNHRLCKVHHCQLALLALRRKEKWNAAQWCGRARRLCTPRDQCSALSVVLVSLLERRNSVAQVPLKRDYFKVDNYPRPRLSRSRIPLTVYIHNLHCTYGVHSRP